MKTTRTFYRNTLIAAALAVGAAAVTPAADSHEHEWRGVAPHRHRVPLMTVDAEWRGCAGAGQFEYGWPLRQPRWQREFGAPSD